MLRIKSIRVDKLFGLYTHVIDLKLNDRVTIIYGLNGVGKTVLLRLLTSLLTGDLASMVKVSFERFLIEFDDDSSLSFEQTQEVLNGESSRSGCICRHVNGERKKVDVPPELFSASKLAAGLAAKIPYLRQLDENTWMDTNDGEIINTETIISRFSPEGRRSRSFNMVEGRRRKSMTFDAPDWLKEVQDEVNVHLIETQRLLKTSESHRAVAWSGDSDEPQMILTVRDYANDLRRRISEATNIYAKESQTLDQSFPQRLMWDVAPSLPIEELKTQMGTIESKRKKLEKIGLIDENSSSPFDVKSLDHLEASQKTAMTLYVGDTAKKLGVLDNLAKRVDLFVDNINRKFRHKSVRIDRDAGFTAIGVDGNALPLDSLSSGEQHELVLTYDLLFRVQPNTMVLIDEPELSLHVSWQKNFLEDLLEIVKTTDFDVVVATHSPFIAGDRSDLMIPLSDA